MVCAVALVLALLVPRWPARSRPYSLGREVYLQQLADYSWRWRERRIARHRIGEGTFEGWQTTAPPNTPTDYWPTSNECSAPAGGALCVTRVELLPLSIRTAAPSWLPRSC